MIINMVTKIISAADQIKYDLSIGQSRNRNNNIKRTTKANSFHIATPDMSFQFLLFHLPIEYAFVRIKLYTR